MAGRLIRFYLDNGADTRLPGRAKHFRTSEIFPHGASHQPADTSNPFHQFPSLSTYVGGGLPVTVRNRSSRNATILDWEPGQDSLVDKAQTIENLPSILHEACHAGLATAVLLLLEAGADAKLPDEDGDTPLHPLARCNRGVGNQDFNVWDTLIKAFRTAGADINAVNKFGATPLIYAVMPHLGRSLEMVKALTMNGASFKDVSPDGRTLFHFLTDAENTYEW